MIKGWQLAALGGICAVFLLVTHALYLHTPFFWDELGQFVPAALDVFRSGALVPYSTIPNVHPPGLMLFLAGTWKVFGYSVLVTRMAMLVWAAIGVVLTYVITWELSADAEFAAPAALLSASLLAVSPLFFSQSMMALLDMPAMVLFTLSFWLFLKERWMLCAICAVALVLVKETGLVAPAVFGLWLWKERRFRAGLWFLLPLAAILVWLALLQRATGHWFGNSEFAQYNLSYPLHPVRLTLALARRLYFLLIANGRVIGFLALLVAWRLPLFRERQWRIAIILAAAHVALICVSGGAVLERYLLPVFPLCYATFAIAIEQLLPPVRRAAIICFVLLLIAGIFISPPYPFPLENNLAWTSFVSLQQRAATFLEARYPNAVIATSFPMEGALRRSEFGFVHRDRRVVEMSDFSVESVSLVKQGNARLLVFYNVLWDPLQLFQNPATSGFLQRYYGYRPQASVRAVEQILGAKLVGQWEQDGFSMECFEW